jgi:hypothetical protein
MLFGSMAALFDIQTNTFYMKLRFLLLLLLPVVMLQAQTDSTDFFSPTPGINKDKKKNTKPPKGYTLPDPKPFGEGIKQEDLRELLTTLAGAEMQGRETGEEGQRKAAAYIAKQFKDLGLPPAGDRQYEQKIQLIKESWKDIGLTVEGKEYKNRTDFYVFPSYNPDLPTKSLKDLVFVGYGIDDPKYSDYGKADVKGKAVIFYDGEPLDNKGNSLITGNEFRSNWSLDWKKKVLLAKQKGATMVFIVDTKFEENLKNNRKLISTYGWKPMADDAEKRANEFIPNVFISPTVANGILGNKADKADAAIAALREGDKFKPVKVKSKLELRLDKEITTLIGSNVIGLIEGSDEPLRYC